MGAGLCSGSGSVRPGGNVVERKTMGTRPRMHPGSDRCKVSKVAERTVRRSATAAGRVTAGSPLQLNSKGEINE